MRRFEGGGSGARRGGSDRLLMGAETVCMHSGHFTCSMEGVGQADSIVQVFQSQTSPPPLPPPRTGLRKADAVPPSFPLRPYETDCSAGARH